MWADKVLPGVIDRQLSRPEFDDARKRVCQGLTGEVVELGFGSGLNVRHYPRAVTLVIAVEPSTRAWHLAARRVGAARMPILRGSLDGQELDLPDESADAVLSTFTLCTVPDADRALAECRRVLRPGGAIHFLEHGASPDSGVARWQRLLDPMQRLVAGGCHLTRPIDRMVTGAGFDMEELDKAYLPGPQLNRPYAFTYLGVARKAA